jgi:hypothetical protein
MSVRFKSAMQKNISLDDHNLLSEINLTKQIIAVRLGSG